MDKIQYLEEKRYYIDIERGKTFSHYLSVLAEICNEIIESKGQKPIIMVNELINIFTFYSKRFKNTVNELNLQNKLLYLQIRSSVNKIQKIIKNDDFSDQNYNILMTYIDEFLQIVNLLLNNVKEE